MIKYYFIIAAVLVVLSYVVGRKTKDAQASE